MYTICSMYIIHKIHVISFVYFLLLLIMIQRSVNYECFCDVFLRRHRLQRCNKSKSCCYCCYVTMIKKNIIKIYTFEPEPTFPIYLSISIYLFNEIKLSF